MVGLAFLCGILLMVAVVIIGYTSFNNEDEIEKLRLRHEWLKGVVDFLEKENRNRKEKDALTLPAGDTMTLIGSGSVTGYVSQEEKFAELRAKEKEEEAKVARLKLLEERDPKIQAWCTKNGLYVYSVDKEHSGREKEHNLPWNWTYCVCRKENIAHQVNYYSDEMARIIGIE